MPPKKSKSPSDKNDEGSASPPPEKVEQSPRSEVKSPNEGSGKKPVEKSKSPSGKQSPLVSPKGKKKATLNEEV